MWPYGVCFFFYFIPYFFRGRLLSLRPDSVWAREGVGGRKVWEEGVVWAGGGRTRIRGRTVKGSRVRTDARQDSQSVRVHPYKTRLGMCLTLSGTFPLITFESTFKIIYVINKRITRNV